MIWVVLSAPKSNATNISINTQRLGKRYNGPRRFGTQEPYCCLAFDQNYHPIFSIGILSIYSFPIRTISSARTNFVQEWSNGNPYHWYFWSRTRRWLTAFTLGDNMLCAFEFEHEDFFTNNVLFEISITVLHISHTNTCKNNHCSIGQQAWIQAKISPATEMVQKEHAKQKARTFDKMVPSAYHAYKDIFEKKVSEQFLEMLPYNHTVDFKPGFAPRNCKVYPQEIDTMNEFINENACKGYICLSKSLMAILFFFVLKKVRSLRPC